MTTELTEQIKAKDSAGRELCQIYYFRKYNGTGEKKVGGLVATIQKINRQEYLTARKVNYKKEVEEQDRMDFTFLIRSIISGAMATGYNEVDITCKVYNYGDLEFNMKIGGRR